MACFTCQLTNMQTRQFALKNACFVIDPSSLRYNLPSMNFTTLTSKDLATITKLLKKKESLLERVAKVDAQLSAFEGGSAPVVVKKGKKAGKRKQHKMSAAGRARIAAAQKARWAKIKAAKAKK